ncbi:DNA (cytosine-5)-methyltransferase 1 [Streptomyces sp. PvR006]|uniref:DNA cytosine methyltransferase n=1 Tax=Streptomyces sp. PvR006 TaxID=2817860 RepID=UPI001AEA1524|nr:DNA cytosine methyltransferase [Streptomyces sp. PvR006]MBP2581875.1 DNA (cytosine-5)-methyltransferase 1 [Streptomyces sp. PvR006]
MPDLRIGSLCTGYGGLDMAVQRVFGGTTAWTSDIDPGAARIIAHRMPQVPNLGDLTTTDWAAVEPVDIVCGGYPCQPLSTAGKRKGTNDDRWIWPSIATALRVLRPRYAIFENVANHVRLGLADVLADLAGLGFDAEWCTVRASEVGAPHHRNRLFILATAQDPDSAARDQRRLAAPGQAESRGARADACGRGGTPAADADRRGLPRHPERHSGPDDGQPEREPRLDLVGRGVQRGPAPHADPSGRRTDQPDVRPGQPHTDWGRFAPAVARWESVTGRRAPWATDDRRRLSPAFVEWLMGLDSGHVTDVPGLTRTQQLHALGNGVVPQQAEAAIRHLYARA